jgi:hypothetical protein
VHNSSASLATQARFELVTEVHFCGTSSLNMTGASTWVHFGKRPCSRRPHRYSFPDAHLLQYTYPYVKITICFEFQRQGTSIDLKFRAFPPRLPLQPARWKLL